MNKGFATDASRIVDLKIAVGIGFHVARGFSIDSPSVIACEHDVRADMLLWESVRRSACGERLLDATPRRSSALL